MFGPGPSSSHTIGPYRICQDFLSVVKEKNPVSFSVTLYGSLALTGKGHFTDEIVKKALSSYPTSVDFVPSLENLAHPNTMELTATLSDGTTVTRRYLSVGGGSFCLEDGKTEEKEVYPFSKFSEAIAYMEKNDYTDIFTMIVALEGEDILDYSKKMLQVSFDTLEKSLKCTGTLPGPLKLNVVSGKIVSDAKKKKHPAEKRIMLLTGYAYAISEANARGEMIVTSPTCGSAGVVPSVLYYEYHHCHYSIDDIARAYLVGAFVCDFIKENASLSGALLGCQAEIGSASSFAAAALSYLHHLSNYQIEYAAEVAMEHFLGLTCDPVDGYVQIPCIERNGMASVHAYSAYLYAKDISVFRKNKVSFDTVVEAMNETGKEIPSDLKETSLGGLAKVLHC